MRWGDAGRGGNGHGDQWWDRLGRSGWGVPTWPSDWFGRGASRGDARLMAFRLPLPKIARDGSLALILRLFVEALGPLRGDWVVVIGVLAAITMTAVEMSRKLFHAL
jgi:hypothetical protein